ncbi:MAG: hypothetical protein U0Z26_10535 [Anaerolineales bacterium]
MQKIKPIHSFIIFLLFAGLACSETAQPVVIPTQVPGALNTIIVETAVAAMTQTVQALPSSTTIPTETLTPLPPTDTPTITPTATFPFTPTPEVPIISVSVATNCRNGPGKVYGYEGALLIGQTAEVLARDPSGEYWYIRNPESSGSQFCWVWGKYATVVGNVVILPVYTPPPTPTPTMTPTPSPSFNPSYSGLDTCAPNWWVDVKLKNNGSIPFKSVDIVVKDTVTSVVIENLSDGFTDINGCLKTTTKDTLGAGDTYLLSSPMFSYDPTGHKLVVTITLCSSTGQKGQCTKKSFDVTP